MSLALLVRAWEHRRDPRAAAIRIVAALATLSGVAAFALFCHFRFHDALAFAHIQNFYGRPITLLGPFLALVRFTVDPDYFLITFAAIAVSVLMIKRTPLWTTISSWFLVLLPMSTGTLRAMIRYQTANVPLLVGAARILRGRVFVIVLWGCLALMAFEAFLFGRGIGHY